MMTVWFHCTGVKGHTLQQEHGPALALSDRSGNQLVVVLTPNFASAFAQSMRNFCSEIDPGYMQRMLSTFTLDQLETEWRARRHELDERKRQAAHKNKEEKDMLKRASQAREAKRLKRLERIAQANGQTRQTEAAP